MAVHVAFNEHLDSPFFGPQTDVDVFTTTPARYRSHVRAAIAIRSSAVVTFPVILPTPLSEGWASIVIGPATSAVATTRDFYALRLNNTNVLFGFRYTATTGEFIAIQNYQNSTLTAIGRWTTSIFAKFDINFKIHATTGFIYVYVDGVLVYSYTGDTTRGGATTMDRVILGATATNNISSLAWTIMSEILVSDEPTIGSKVITRPFTAFGATNNWTGAIADINAAASPDTTFMSETTAGDILLMSSAAIPTMLAGEFISTVALTFRANFEPTSPVTRIDPIVRVGTTNYFGAQKNLINTVAAYQERWDTNPATGAAWLEAAVNAMQMGFRAAA